MATLQLAIDARLAKQGAAEWDQATAQVRASSAGTTRSIEQNFRGLLKAGMFTYLANSVMDTGTSMLKAKRHGESMFEAFIAGLPVINRLAKSARELADELSGLADAEETLKATRALTTGMGKIQEDMGRYIRLQETSSEVEKNRLEALFRYEDRLKAIDEAEKAQIKTINEHNKSILNQIEAIKKLPSQQKFAIGGFGSMGVGPMGISETERQRRIAELERGIIEYKPVGAGARQIAEKERLVAEGEIIKAEQERLAKIHIERTRQEMESIRHQDYLTRMERIENLEKYRDAHSDIMRDVIGQETEAGKLLREEIESLKQSRLDAMEVYYAELREDFEELSLYQSEKATEAAQSIEGSMSNAFQSIISEGASFRDAMSQFFTDVGSAFSRMASDMLARAIMMQIMNAIMPGGGGFASGVSATATPGAGRFAMGGVFDRGRIVPMASGDIFNRPTLFPMADGRIGLMGEGGEEAAMPLKRMRSGRLGVETSGSPIVNVSPTPVKVIVVANYKQAALEAQRSAEGQAVTITTLRENGLI